MTRKGYTVVAESVKASGTEVFFFLPGGPLTPVLTSCVELGIKGIDVRDERAAAFAAIGYSRAAQRPGVVMSAAGPGTTNIVTGVSHAFADGVPLVAIGGSASLFLHGTGAFQDTDQVSLMRPITKLSHQVQSVQGIATGLVSAFRTSVGGQPGPVYVDFPADILYGDIDGGAEDVQPPMAEPIRSLGDPRRIDDAVKLLESSQKPIIIAGSGVLWSKAWSELQALVDTSGIPVFTTPIARGLVPEDHPLCLNASRTTAFSQSDCVLVIGTRLNYVINWVNPPVFASGTRVIQLNVHPADLAQSRNVDVAILGDAKLALPQLTSEIKRRLEPGRFAKWAEQLRRLHSERIAKIRETPDFDGTPIHPLRLCTILQQVLPRDAVVVVDGHEILGFSRQSLTARLPGHMLTPGAYGTMGVGVPFGIGAKVAQPEAPVVVLTGDGAFGFHAMELDTAVRHQLGIVVVISNNGGWGGGNHDSPGSNLGFTNYDRLADVFGAWGARVTEPDEIKPALTDALEFARRHRKPAIVNVITSAARAGGRSFAGYAPV
jgi:thiamine pyrophosphate-dependent acetolactate synthase large subunit-like protein